MSTEKKSIIEPERSCCRIEAVVTVDERGQMVLPKEVREKAGLGPGDKLALLAWEKDGEVCCISLIKTDQMADMVRNLISPMVSEIRT